MVHQCSDMKWMQSFNRLRCSGHLPVDHGAGFWTHNNTDHTCGRYSLGRMTPHQQNDMMAESRRVTWHHQEKREVVCSGWIKTSSCPSHLATQKMVTMTAWLRGHTLQPDGSWNNCLATRSTAKHQTCTTTCLTHAQIRKHSPHACVLSHTLHTGSTARQGH